MATVQQSESARLPLILVLVARIMRSRVDAIAYNLAEFDRAKERGTRPNAALFHLVATYGGHPDLILAAAQSIGPEIGALFRRAAAIPDLVMPHLPSAEDAYRLYRSGYRHVPVPERKPPKKSNLWMQIVEPAGRETA